jgi:flagellar basal-body rod modification protein FlgD
MPTVDTAPPFVSQDLLNSVNAKKTTAPEGSVQADTDKFMMLLVTQLKNQDPLNPLDNAQLTSQLAQLSTVTGINKLNETLETLKASYQSSESLQATNLIGHGVLVAGNFVHLVKGEAGSNGILGVELATPADSVQVIITDPRTGKDVQTIDLGKNAAGTIPVAWDGVLDPSKVDEAGKPIALKEGKYLFRVVATRGGEEIKDAATLSFDSVASVTTSAKDGVKLNLPTKGIVTMAEIKQIL